MYLSPHLDDAALSQGGSIAAERQRGLEVRVLTVFSGLPELDELSEVARGLHAQWSVGADPDAAREVVETRRGEDRLAMEALGVRSIYLDRADCIYRWRNDGRWRIEEEADVFAGIEAEDRELVASLAKMLDQIEGVDDETLVIAPLGVGRHCDHEIVRAAAERWKPKCLRYYEDFPYVLHPGQLSHTLGPAECWEAELIRLDEGQITTRLRAACAYRSQVPFLFGDEAGLERAVRAYALDCGEAGTLLSERRWRLQAALPQRESGSRTPRASGVASHGLPKKEAQVWAGTFAS